MVTLSLIENQNNISHIVHFSPDQCSHLCVFCRTCSMQVWIHKWKLQVNCQASLWVPCWRDSQTACSNQSPPAGSMKSFLDLYPYSSALSSTSPFLHNHAATTNFFLVYTVMYLVMCIFCSSCVIYQETLWLCMKNLPSFSHSYLQFTA